MLYLNKQSTFLIYLIVFCLFYLFSAILYNHFILLSVDDFWFAHNAYHYQFGLPYRDFLPYKTVLGYYLLLIPMLSNLDVISTLILTKNTIAIVNTILFFLSSVYLKKYFDVKGILISLIILFFTETVITTSTNIRVDFFSYWFCFFSLLFLLEKRYLLAGLLIGLGFITSQKAAWYILASNIALCGSGLLFHRSFKTLKQIILFNVMWCFVIGMYTIFWSYIANWHIVINNMFLEAANMYHLNSYNKARQFFWEYILVHNPLVFLLMPCTLLSLMFYSNKDKLDGKRVFIILYAFTIVGCLIPYKQVFPYYMQATTLVFFVLYAAFFDWLITIFQPDTHLIFLVPKKMLGIFLIGYAGFVIFLMNSFFLPLVYLLVLFIPALIICFSHFYLYKKYSPLIFNLILLSLMFVGVFYPSILLINGLLNNRGDYQKENIKMMTKLLDKEDYVAGVEFIYHHTQSISGMRHLMLPALEYLKKPTPELKRVMLSSLYEDPNVTKESIIESIKNSNVKLYVNNYRMEYLPLEIKNFLQSEYDHYWGSIYLYSPRINFGKQKINLRFSGVYQIHSSYQGNISLNGKKYHTNENVFLEKGKYISKSSFTYRLKLVPKNHFSLNPNYFKDDWQKMVY